MKKSIQFITLILAMCCPVFAQAEKPVFLITPITKAPSIIYAGQTVTPTYNIKNNTPYTLNGNGVIELPMGVTLAGGSCSTPFNLASGASCTQTLQIVADELRGDVRGGPIVCNTLDNPIYCSRPAIGNELSVIKNPNPPPITRRIVAVGSYSHGAVTSPLSYFSIDGGQSWTLSTITGQGTTGVEALRDVACDSSGINCVAVGYYSATGSPTTSAVATSYISTNGGQTWTASPTQPPVAPTASVTLLVGVSCDNTFLNCAATGSYFNSSQHPLNYISTNGGQSWSISLPPAVVPAAANALNIGISCYGNNLTCATIGQTNPSPIPISYLLANAQSSWVQSTIPPVPSATATLPTNIFCANSGSSCVAVGFYFDGSSNFPITYMSTDGGANWTINLPLPSAPSSDLYGVSCNNSATNCTAVGNSTLGPISLVSTDSGQTWLASQTPPPLVGTGVHMEKVFCSDTGQNCIAIGWSNSPNISYTAMSKDGGNIWTLTNQPPSPLGATTAQLYGISGQTTL